MSLAPIIITDLFIVGVSSGSSAHLADVNPFVLKRPAHRVYKLHRAGRAGLGNRHVLRVYSSDNNDVFLIACESLPIGTSQAVANES